VLDYRRLEEPAPAQRQLGRLAVAISEQEVRLP
jgi:hypothetical protein